MGRIPKTILFLIALLFNFQLYAQDKTITGKVVSNEDNSPLAGATIQIKGSQKGTIADADGIFMMTFSGDTNTLVVSFVGYLTEEKIVTDESNIEIALIPNISKLDEVVVVGYGVQKKNLVTGSISKVKTEDIVSTPSLRVEQALQGRTSGVVFNQTSGNPGAQITVRIRGVGSNYSADPLFIVNGLKTSKYVMNEIDPSDIESVEVLKDAASSAIYGSEGANGVIIITTKSGNNKKEHTQIQYDAYYGIQKAKPVKVMSAKEYRDYFAEAYAYNKRLAAGNSLNAPATSLNNLYDIYPTSQDSLTFTYNTPEYKYSYLVTKLDEAVANGSITQAQYESNLKSINKKKALSFDEYKSMAYRSNSGYAPFAGNIDTVTDGTNWMDKIFQVAPFQKHHLSLTTSTEKTNLYLGLSYYSQDGVVGGPKNNFTRYNLTVSADNQAKSWLKLGSNLTIAQSKSKNLPVNDIYNNVVLSAMCFDPTIGDYWKNTSDLPSVYLPLKDSLLTSSDGKYYTISPVTSGERVNPLAKIEVEQHNTTTTQRAFGDIFAEIKLFRGLTYRLSFTGELSYVSNDIWQPRFYYTTEFYNHRSYVSQEIQKYLKTQVDNVLTYNKDLQNHSFNIMLGYSFEKNRDGSVRAQRYNLFLENDNFDYIDAVQLTTDNEAIQQTGGSRTLKSMVSYFGRLNYNYKEKYLFTATVRRDGSSMFEKNHRFGTFPSVSVGWNINRENFFNIPEISLLKIRASWGQNGSISNIRPNLWVSTTTIENGGRQVVKNAIFNKNLTWETSEQTNIGFDLGMFDNKLTLSAEYYNKVTKNLLAKPEGVIWRPVGENQMPYYNAGKVSNKGVEFELGYTERHTNFKYDIKFTSSYLKNKVLDFKAGVLPGYRLFSGRQHTNFEEGQPVYYFQGYKVLGVFQNWDEIRNYTYTNPTTGATNLIQPDAQPGDPKIQDVGGGYDSKGNPIPDGTISTADFTYLGKPLPSWTFGLNLNCEYKSFDFSMFFYAEWDKTIFNALTRDDRTYYNRPESFYTDRWTESNHTNNFIRASYENTGGYAFGHNSFFFEDGSFLRLKNIQLGYTLPSSLTNKVSVSKLRIYISASNLWTLTKYKGSDPEIGQTQTNNPYTYGVDMGLYPSAKQYLVGVNVTF